MSSSLAQKLYMLVVYLVVLVLSVLHVVSCGPQSPAEHSKELVQYIEWAERTFQYSAKYVKVVLVDKAPGEPPAGHFVAGSCHKGEVFITQSIFKSLTEHYRNMLIAHELGHCLLGLGHDDTIEDGCPVSYMYPQLNYVTSGCWGRMKK